MYPYGGAAADPGADGPQEAWKGTCMDRTEYVDTSRLALHTGIAASTWSKRRCTGDTPNFYKIGARVLYRLADVEKWMEARARNSTSDA